MSIRVVCFDLGGVVVRICRSWQEACARAGVQAPDAAAFARPELAARRRELVEAYQTGRKGCDEFFDALAGATGGQHSAHDVRRVHNAWIIEDYASIDAVIDGLNRTRGVVSACLSNTNHAHWAGMLGLPGGEGWRSPSVEALRLTGASQLLGCAKPGLEIYRKAEGLFGASGPEIVFFDDLAENVAAASGLGWRAFQIDHEGDTAAQVRGALLSLGISV
ncbi:MAG: HAD family hydrolase [Phycisphaerales bacterium]